MSNGISRRRFIGGAAAGVAGAMLAGRAWQSSALAVEAAGRRPPSDRINMGCIGFRNMGMGHLRTLVGRGDVQVVAVCDVDAEIRGRGRQRVHDAYAAQMRSGTYHGCAEYNDFREMLARDDIDAIMVGTPDHWHALMGIEAARRGKDMYIEKPLTLTIAEGRALADAAKRYGRIVQTGSQQRSSERFRFACELVRNGRIGRLHTVRVSQPRGRSTGVHAPMPVPAGFDYDMWLGPAPWHPYTKDRCHYNFRFILDYSGGQMTNFGAHDLDIAQWGIGADDSGPVEVEGTGDFPREGLFDTAVSCRIEYRYANDVRVICQTGGGGSVRFEGDEGWVHVSRGTLDANPRSLLSSRIGPGEIHLYRSNSHWGDFLQCVRTRRDPICPAEVGHRTATVCHMGNIAMLLGRKLRWDPAAERFVGDDDANRMIGRAMRGAWRL